MISGIRQRFLRAQLRRRTQLPIVCIGDSNACVFGGVDELQPHWPLVGTNRDPFFEVHTVGPVLAHSLANPSHHGTLATAAAICAGAQRGRRTFLFSFGEIDCRAHLLRRAHDDGIALSDLVRACVEGYVDRIATLLPAGSTAILWGPPTLCDDDTGDANYPVAGSREDRLALLGCFNAQLEEAALRRGLRFASVFGDIYSGRRVKSAKLKMDSVHLSQVAMPWIIRSLVRSCRPSAGSR